MKARILFSMFSLLLCFGLSAQSIGIIGSSTPGGWDMDTDMTQDAVNPDIWTISITLFDGAAKFRQDDAWDANWGGADFPVGVGEQDGPDIPVFAGDYFVTFNTSTGEYNFEVASDIGIIGSATANGWDSDTNMFIDQTDPNKYFMTIDLAEGEVKFRQDDAWDVDWGSADFPIGVGVQGGDNIPVSPAGTYRVDFDKSTGAYSFEQIITFTSVGIVGTSTPGGATETPMVQSTSDAAVWMLNASFTEGDASFVGNGTIMWADALWPSGVATENGPVIPVEAGDYQVTFNTETGEYSFLEIVEYSTVGIIGDATPGGWADDTDMEKDPNNGALWTLRVILGDGEAKFRAEDDWAVNWGSGDFPVGVGIIDGANIPVTAGEYNITFNSITGAYTFEEIVVFGTVGLIGPATPIGDWDTDVDMTLNPDNEHLWIIEEIDLVDGEGKFRAEDDWAVNWGLDVWPAGIGEQDGPNIPITGGTWYVSINTLTGEYAFVDPALNTQTIVDANSIKVYPNPTNSILNIDFDGIDLKDEVQIRIVDMNGKVHQLLTMDTNSLQSVDVSNLVSGHYLLQISNDQITMGKRFSVNK